MQTLPPNPPPAAHPERKHMFFKFCDSSPRNHCGFFICYDPGTSVVQALQSELARLGLEGTPTWHYAVEDHDQSRKVEQLGQAVHDKGYHTLRLHLTPDPAANVSSAAPESVSASVKGKGAARELKPFESGLLRDGPPEPLETLWTTPLYERIDAAYLEVTKSRPEPSSRGKVPLLVETIRDLMTVHEEMKNADSTESVSEVAKQSAEPVTPVRPKRGVSPPEQEVSSKKRVRFQGIDIIGEEGDAGGGNEKGKAPLPKGGKEIIEISSTEPESHSESDDEDLPTLAGRNKPSAGAGGSAG